jgi:rhamnosyltransferase
MLTPSPQIQDYFVIVPTLNAASDWPRFAPALLACVPPDRVLIVDSESTDGTPELALAAGFGVVRIARREFNHGGTRQWAVQFTGDAEILIFLTQDAVLADPGAVARLLAAFEDPAVAAAYGRQLPRPEAGTIEAHARHFNYPASSDMRNLQSRERLGIKAIFISNSFAAYRRSALMAIGGFPTHVIFGEDTVAAGHLLLSGHKIAYVAEARVYHSHPYSQGQEFRRYFDIGVLHSRERWLLDQFGRANGEGKRFVLSELKCLSEHDTLQIPSAMARTVLKLVGYRLGKMEAQLSPAIKRRLSGQPSFWPEAEAPDTQTKI